MDFNAELLHTVAPLAWVPWVPWNPSFLEKWVPEPINLGKKRLKFTLFSSKNKQEIGVGSLRP